MLEKIRYFFTLNLFFCFIFPSLFCQESDNPSPCPCPWYLKKEVLYWTTHEDGLEYTTKSSNVLTTDNFTTKSLIHPTFHWEYGFRIQCGYKPAQNPWEFMATWTSLASKATGSQTENSSSPDFRGIFPVWSMSPDTLASDYASTASMHWLLDTTIIDVDALYLLCDWDSLQITPIIGLRGAILNQKLHVKYSGGTFFDGIDDNIMRNKFSGGGPKFGFSGKYLICPKISFIGLATIAPLYGHFDTSHREFYLDTQRFSQNAVIDHFVLSCDFRVGLEWKGKILECMPEVALALSWEGHDFFRQNKLYRGTFDFFKKDRDLILEGWTLYWTMCF